MSGKIVNFSASPFYVYKKQHFCPDCNALLEVSSVSATVKSNIANRSKLRMSGGLYFLGNVEIVTKCFYCSKCNTYITFDAMKYFEGKINKTI